MLFRGKPLESINESDLQSLIENGVAESKTIEYKLKLPADSEADKKEFLADASSFANASGGHLIYGIKASEAIAEEVTGLEITNSIDSEILRLENIIRDGISPRIIGVKIHPIKLHNSKFVIAIEVPQSWLMPHMVVFKNLSRFFSRNSAGKYQLDVAEIRSIFAFSESYSTKIRNFRLERLSKVISGEIPVRLNETPKTILHIIPFSAFNPTTNLDLVSFKKNDHIVERLKPIYASGWGNRYNFDGFLTFDSDSYVQFFRNGSIEAVEASMLNPIDDKKLIPDVFFERELIESLTNYLKVLQMVGMEPPFIVMLSLFGVEGYRIPYTPEVLIAQTIDRNTLVLPEVLSDNYECDASELMRPIFDSLWNSAGFPRSLNYSNEGKWNPQRR